MDSPVLPTAAMGGIPFFDFRNKLRKLCLKISIKYDVLPKALVLQGVQLTDRDQRGTGGFADVFCGTFGRYKVALKRLRVYAMTSESHKKTLQQVAILSTRPNSD